MSEKATPKVKVDSTKQYEESLGLSREAIVEYILSGIKTNLIGRNNALQLANSEAFHYHQGGLDVLTDLETLITGGLLEIAVKKAKVNNIDTV